MARGLSDEFFRDLESGLLAPLRERVVADKTLCLEIRENYINIYYRGGNLVELRSDARGYVAKFDKEYFRGSEPPPLPQSQVRKPENVAAWLEVMPRLKLGIDLFLGKKRKEEREVQQLILRENNFGRISSYTDHYVCDIEYAVNRCRFDLIAVQWPSDGKVRKQQDHRRLVLGEVKYGDDALDGKSGLHAHVEDVNRHLADAGTVAALKSEMVRVFNQKRALKLITSPRALVGFSDELPILLLLFANHKPGNTRLRQLLSSLPECPNAELRIASACMLGYGLYSKTFLDPLDALVRFEQYI